ncbi:MAG TPA: DUF4239 domain-containing protein [Verrucomicrobiota bacterium]|nr:hypothetical protein [Verrucomicrobiales bacterium]HRI13267.1 DUF4239 domain-containing protein [Verrucomicrobiota bacterium]
MADWLYHLPVISMAVVVFTMTFLGTGLIYGAVLVIAKEGRGRSLKGMSPVMLTPLAVVFGLLVGFLSAQVWNDADRANAAVAREASALHTVVLLAARLPKETATRLRGFVRRHIQDAVQLEWPAMAGKRATLNMLTQVDTEALQFIFAVPAQNEAQIFAQREMVAALENALEARRQRIIISRSTINGVKWAVVILLAALILLTIAIVHIDNRVTAAVAMAIFATGLAACIVLIASHNRPFTGEISVGPDLLLQVMPEE